MRRLTPELSASPLYFVSGTSSAFMVSLLAVIQDIITVTPPTSMSLRHSHQLKHVIVWIFEVNASAAIPIVELAIVQAPRSTAA
jgi:hypothetical protein